MSTEFQVWVDGRWDAEADPEGWVSVTVDDDTAITLFLHDHSAQEITDTLSGLDRLREALDQAAENLHTKAARITQQPEQSR